MTKIELPKLKSRSGTLIRTYAEFAVSTSSRVRGDAPAYLHPYLDQERIITFLEFRVINRINPPLFRQDVFTSWKLPAHC